MTAVGPDPGKARTAARGVALGLLAGAAIAWLVANRAQFEMFRVSAAAGAANAFHGTGQSETSGSNAPTSGVWKEFANMTANLAGGSGALQATVDIELNDEAAKERLERARPLVQARILDVLSKVSYERIVEPDAKPRLAEAIRDKVNSLLSAESGASDVRRVVFSAFVFSSD